MPGPYIEEFLFRGRDATHEPGQAAAWHVVLGNWIDDGMGGKTLARSTALTPEQAEDQGFPLETVLAGINAVALEERDALAVQLAQAQAANQELADSLATALDQVRGMAVRLETAGAEIARLTALKMPKKR